MEVTVNEKVSVEEVLVFFGRLKSSHLPLLSSRWPMRVLGAIVQTSSARKQWTLSDPIAPDLVGQDYLRHVLQPLQQTFEEALRRVGIGPGLNEDVEQCRMP
jgi:hypothetical protein